MRVTKGLVAREISHLLQCQMAKILNYFSLSLSLFKKKFDYNLTADIFYWITSLQIDEGELLF